MLFPTPLKANDKRAVGWLILVISLLFGVVVVAQTISIYTDYRAHLRFAVDIAENGRFALPHILYPFTVIAISKVLPFGYVAASVLVNMAIYGLTGFILYRCVRPSFSTAKLAPSWTAVLALALMLVAPLSLPALNRDALYYGYIPANAVHNPTTVLVKPLSLLLFLFCVAVFEQQLALNARTFALGAALTLLGVWAKPNYILCLLPALAVMTAYFLARCRRVSWQLLAAAVFAPALLSLGIQYFWTYQAQMVGEGGSLVIAPLASILPYEPAVMSLLIKLLLSIAFPALVYILHLPQARNSTALALGWLTFFAGAAQFYLLAETGERALHGNWWWGAQIAVWVLFVTTAVFLTTQAPSKKRTLCWIIFLMHVLSGVFYILAGFASHGSAA